MGKQKIFTKEPWSEASLTSHIGVDRQTCQVGQREPGDAVENQGDQPRSRLDNSHPELPGDAIPEVGGADFRN